jgi:AraC-like DNA-binding protein
MSGEVMGRNKKTRLFRFEDFGSFQGLSATLHNLMDCQGHRHDFYEFECVLEGRCEYVLNDKKYILTSGDIIFVTPVDFHSFRHVDSLGTKMLTVHIDSTVYQLPKNISAGVVSGENRLLECFKNLYEEYVRNAPFRREMLENILQQIILLYLRTQPSDENKAKPDSINYALGYISKHYSEDVTLESISKLCGYNTSYFCRKFKEHTGTGFVSYLNHIRLLNAANLLVANYSVSITQISEECGFNSLRHFNREFKNEFGLSPSEYRKSQNLSLE